MVMPIIIQITSLHTTFIPLICYYIRHSTLNKKPTNNHVLGAQLCVCAAVSHTTKCGPNHPSLDFRCSFVQLTISIFLKTLPICHPSRGPVIFLSTLNGVSHPNEWCMGFSLPEAMQVC